MPQTYFSSKPDTETNFQCRHIFTDGRRCASPCLRLEEFCYYHHTTRRPVPTASLRSRKRCRGSFALPLPEDRSAIQHSIGEVLQRIAANDLDPRRAGLLLYGLQIASLNLPKDSKSQAPPESSVTDIVFDPTHGPLAPTAELHPPELAKGPVARLLEELGETEDFDLRANVELASVEEPASAGDLPQPTNLPVLQASAAPPPSLTRAKSQGCRFGDAGPDASRICNPAL